MPFKDVEKRRQYDRERRRRQRAGVLKKKTKPGRSAKADSCKPPRSESFSGNPPAAAGDYPIETLDDIRRMLTRQVASVEAADVDEIARARTITYIANVLVRILEVRDIEQRIEALEAMANQRREQEEQAPC